MTVRLKLGRIRVVEVVTDSTEQFEVVVSDLRPVVTCPSCGVKTSKMHDARRAKIKGPSSPRSPHQAHLAPAPLLVRQLR